MEFSGRWPKNARDLVGDRFDRPMSEATIEGVSVQAAGLLAPLSHGLQGLALAAALWWMGWGAGLGD
ncbi:hypothetical protein [Verminephrobacter eiseniae]|uniref:hypothetical protein n=1 Tax=Verminephrobacter eiseniae TaxID=364317 RepID=UPI0010EC4786|nr:hypothetical protein [Verminephrobacter eiseniae]KAB7590689.1 hypothetical protein ET532_015135 [Verminephrobacter sp. Larva24]MCW5234560.1 hypothetical protein [Verminephrobacter eiseniae]MCW5293864.1 hypothetical protein [Verminephrobacter eiseniae]MCW8183871.1 hypothetical protein [Verminephrobacter eiseniae]MCW8222381.1 hypothetical protein [Verminephrobacter eiseniae]